MSDGVDDYAPGERRGIASRLGDLERQYSHWETRVTILEVKMDGLITTQKSNFDSLEKGQALVMSRLEYLISLKDRVIGGVWLVSLLGVTGIIGGVVAIVKVLKGP